jgi:outer membrane lipoprotein carrier protein
VRFSWVAALIGAVIGSPIVHAQTAAPDATELAQSLQRKYDTIKDFSADFVHTYRGGVLKREATERGRLFVKKPGKMRWEYTTPEEKLFVSDGARVYTYIPQDKQVLVSSLPTGDQAATPALFLAGRGNLMRDFTASPADAPAGVPAGTRAIRLVPRTPQTDYEAIVLAIDPKSMAIRALTTFDAQGGTSTFVFTNFKENIGTADKLFVFDIPRGVHVVAEPSR